MAASLKRTPPPSNRAPVNHNLCAVHLHLVEMERAPDGAGAVERNPPARKPRSGQVTTVEYRSLEAEGVTAP